MKLPHSCFGPPDPLNEDGFVDVACGKARSLIQKWCENETAILR